MKKAQVVKFWKAIEDSTDQQEIISSFMKKPGYDGKRTLERYVQALNGFKQGLSLEVVAKKTGWLENFVGKIKVWWDMELSVASPVPTQTDICDPDHAALLKSIAAYGSWLGTVKSLTVDQIASLPNKNLQQRIIYLRPDLRIIGLCDDMGDVVLTPEEKEISEKVLANPDFAVKSREVAERCYRRIRMLEMRHRTLSESDIKLISEALKLEADDDQFDRLLDVSWFNEEPDPIADVISAAAKLLSGIGEQQVLDDEIEKDMSRNVTSQAGAVSAEERVKWAKGVVSKWLPSVKRTIAQNQ
ncbi:hypothetical protein ACFLTV_00300 [Chloroflexota bacterium]